MEQTKQQIPAEAVEAYTQYIHGEIDRRAFMSRVNKVAVSTVAAAAIVDQLMPNYAAAQQVSPTDTRLKTEYATVPSPNGNGSIKGYLVRPASAGSNKLPSILVVHENRGLNPHIEDVARRLALENFMAFAPDGLTSVGGYPGDDEKGGELFGKVDRTKMAEDLYAAAVWLKSRPDSTGRLGVTGFCFGGGIANSLAVRMGPDLAAAVPFYGGAPPVADVPKIKAAVLVHHGSEDKRLVDGMARVRGGAEGGRRHVRRAHLSGRGPRLQQRRHAAALQQGRRRRGVEAHGRVVQQVRSSYDLTSHPPMSRLPSAIPNSKAPWESGFGSWECDRLALRTAAAGDTLTSEHWHEAFRRYRQSQGNRNARGDRDSRRRDDQPVVAREGIR